MTKLKEILWKLILKKIGNGNVNNKCDNDNDYELLVVSSAAIVRNYFVFTF